MKIHIEYTMREGPWGGGNQFLIALNRCLANAHQLAGSSCKADIILFDSFHDIGKVLLAKKLNPHAIFIHRLNGPISGYRGRGKHIDYLIYSLTKHLADGVIFQSLYSKNANLKLGVKCPVNIAVIQNAARPIFFDKQRQLKTGKRIKIIASSWSSNINKGFDFYLELDKKLDFSKFEFTFIGNSPFEFKNIKSLPPMDGSLLSKSIADKDIYITGAKNDPCSNSVLEALAVGLPVVAHKSGGNPELVGRAGEYFETVEESILALNKVANDLTEYKKQIKFRDMSIVHEEYEKFFKQVLINSPKPKKLSFVGLTEIYFWRIVRTLMLIFYKIIILIGLAKQ